MRVEFSDILILHIGSHIVDDCQRATAKAPGINVFQSYKTLHFRVFYTQNYVT